LRRWRDVRGRLEQRTDTRLLRLRSSERSREAGGWGGASPALREDVDADGRRAARRGEEGVGGTVATPDQEVVDESDRALGVEQPSEAEVQSSEELLHDRDGRRWQLEREAAEENLLGMKRSWYEIIGMAAIVVLAVGLWRGRHRRRGARIAAEEARMEPSPVVY
jgi:Family of unknown function (DUF6335)